MPLTPNTKIPIITKGRIYLRVLLADPFFASGGGILTFRDSGCSTGSFSLLKDWAAKLPEVARAEKPVLKSVNANSPGVNAPVAPIFTADSVGEGGWSGEEISSLVSS